MNRLKCLVLALIAAFALTACEPAANTASNNAAATNGVRANSNSNANSTTAAAPTKEALMTLEQSAYDAWKNKNAAFWDPFLTANFVGYGSTGKLDKAAAMKEFASSDCDVKSTTMSDEQMTQLGPDAALITYKLAQDATCGGQKLPANAWAASVFVREGGNWKGAFHAEAPVADPNAKPAAASAPAKPAPAANTAPATPPDAATETMFALEKKAWEYWKNKDTKGLEEWSSPNMITFTDKGRETRADAIKTWTTEPCEIRSANLTDPASTPFGPDFALLTFKSAVDGKCAGNPLPPMHGVSIYAKEAGAWKALFTMNSPM